MNASNFYRSRCQGRGFEHYCKTCRKETSIGAWSKVSKAAKVRKNTRKKFNLPTRANSLLSAYRKYDKKHNVLFSLNKEELMNVLSMSCVYCGESSLHKLGADRIDNKKGHTLDNIVTCCDECNTARSDHFNCEEMLIIGESIELVKLGRVMAQCPGNFKECDLNG